MKSVWAVGLMTGTVLDGYIDVALLKTDGDRTVEFGPYSLEPYQTGTVELLKETLESALNWNFSGPEPDIFRQAEQLITAEQSQAVANVLSAAGIDRADVAAIGFHGQTVLHHPPDKTTDGSDERSIGQTRQLGNGQAMADNLGIPVVWDFRSADMRSGGQGAPLAPVYHRALLQKARNEHTLDGNVAILNLGGVANITWWGGGDRLAAFDTGPANAPINDWVIKHGLGRMDVDGKLAASGSVDENKLKELLEHPYLSAPWPKSLDRFDFSAAMAEGCSAADGASLLTAFSAAAVGKALDLLPERPGTLVLSGGGRHNPVLADAISNRAAVNIVNADELGWRGDAVEAECFAYLAIRSLQALPLSFPSTTGVTAACKGGIVSYPVD